MRMIHWLRTAALVLAAATLTTAQAQTPNWPSKPIRWIIPYTPGGITDSATRMVVQKITEQTGWSIVVDNKPGANSILGADLAAVAAVGDQILVAVVLAEEVVARHDGGLPVGRERQPVCAVEPLVV